MWRVLRAQVYASQPPTETKRAPERGALYAYITLGSRLPAGVLGRGDWGVGGAPGTDKSWPMVILRLYKIAHFSMEQCELSPQLTVAKPATRPAE
jgi:hypothetical protein